MQNVENSQPGTADTTNQAATGQVQAAANPLKELAEALRRTKSSDGEPAGKPGAADNGSEGKPLKEFNDLAGKLGVELDDLYKLEVSGTDGKKYTVEHLKGLLAEQESFTVRSLKFEEDTRRKEAELFRAEENLRELMGLIPDSALTPDTRKKISDKVSARLAEEAAKLVQAIPEWRDEATQANERKQMAEHLRDYGIPEQQLAGIVDHRLLRYIRTNMVRDQRIAAALAKVQEVQTGANTGRSKPPAERRGGPRQRGSSPYERNVAAFSSIIHNAGK